MREGDREGLALLEFGAAKAQRLTSRNTWTRPGRCYVLLATAQRLAGECTVQVFLVAVLALPALNAACKPTYAKMPSP